MFEKKKTKKIEKIKVVLNPFQINELKKIKGNLLVISVGDTEHLPTQKQIDNVWETVKNKLPKKIRVFIVPYYYRFEMIK